MWRYLVPLIIKFQALVAAFLRSSRGRGIHCGVTFVKYHFITGTGGSILDKLEKRRTPLRSYIVPLII